MEIKVIFYIIIGVLYFLYTIGKRVEQKKKESAPPSVPEESPGPTSAPFTNPLEDMMRELTRKQEEVEARKKVVTAPKPIVRAAPKQLSRDILLKEQKRAQMAEGVENYEAVFERELTAEEKIHSGAVRIKNEGVYELQEAGQSDETAFEFDARKAFIGTVIFERKF